MANLAHVALALTLGTAACAAPRQEKPSLGKPAAETRRPVVRVANQHFSDVTVYVVQAGMRMRLGTVTGLSEQTFRLPGRHAVDAAELYLVADPVGGFATYRSPAVRVYPGDEVDLRVHATLSMSTVSVWGP